MATAPSDFSSSVAPTPDEALLALEGSRRLAQFEPADASCSVHIQSSSAPEEAVAIPAAAFRLLREILNEMAQGHAVSLLAVDTELTTQQAADLLNVSRPFLVEQLEKGAVPYRKVGTHRRVLFKDLMAYKQTMDRNRLKTLDELTAQRRNSGWVIEVSGHTVLLDACVLYPAPLRDFLMHLAVSDLFRAKWTDAIHDEWINGVLAKRPDLSATQLQRTRDLMNAHVRDCLVVGYEHLIASLTLPDANDRHVLAAAIHGGADVILTFNLKDFPEATLMTYDIVVQHPDDFLVGQFGLTPQIVLAAAARHRASLKNPAKGVDEYLQTLEMQGIERTIAELRRFSALI